MIFLNIQKFNVFFKVLMKRYFKMIKEFNESFKIYDKN